MAYNDWAIFTQAGENRYTWRMHRFGQLVRLLVVVGASSASYAQEEEAIARVVVQRGEVVAIAPDGSRRNLARRSEIFPGDTLVTSDDGFLQARFSDRAILSLSCGSELEIREFQYLDRNNDRVHLHLNRGKARTVTGAIQRRNYRFTTDLAEVRIAGTDYEVAVAEETHFFGVYDGAITVSNSLDTVSIGVGELTNFARIGADGAPEAIPLAPAQFSSNVTSVSGC